MATGEGEGENSSLTLLMCTFGIKEEEKNVRREDGDSFIHLDGQ